MMTEQKKRGRPRKVEAKPVSKPAAKKPVNWQALAKRLDKELKFAYRDIQALGYEITVLQSIIENMNCNKSWFSRLFSSKG